MGNRSVNIALEKPPPVTKLVEVRKKVAHYLTQPLVRLMARTAITPNALTWFGLVLFGGAAALIVTEHLLAAGFLVLVAGLFDLLDGALARATNQVTRFGAVLDSTVDRLTEAVLLLSILLLYGRAPSITGVLLVGLALTGSLLVSYIRARAEAIKVECEAGLFTRGERIIILALGLLLSQFSYALMIALGLIGLFSFFTVGQRLFHVWRQTKTD